MGTASIGWHNFSNELLLFHAQLQQFLHEPAKEQERMRREAISMKNFIETIIECPMEVNHGSDNISD